jgi:hydrogenase maturation protease
MKQILIAGIGNIFLGDDAFGCEVVRQLKDRAFPEKVAVNDFGIASYDLAYALTSGYDAVILVDAVLRGGKPGTLYLIEPEVTQKEESARTAPDGHAMNPMAVIQLAQTLGGVNGKLYLIGCEPAVLESEDGDMSLSAEVKEAVPGAISMIESLVKDIFEWKENPVASQAAA